MNNFLSALALVTGVATNKASTIANDIIFCIFFICQTPI